MGGLGEGVAVAVIHALNIARVFHRDRKLGAVLVFQGVAAYYLEGLPGCSQAVAKSCVFDCKPLKKIKMTEKFSAIFM